MQLSDGYFMCRVACAQVLLHQTSGNNLYK